MPPTIFSYINTDTFAYLLQAVNSPYFLQVYVLLPLLLSAIMFNNGTANSLSLFTIYSISLFFNIALNIEVDRPFYSVLKVIKYIKSFLFYTSLI